MKLVILATTLSLALAAVPTSCEASGPVVKYSLGFLQGAATVRPLQVRGDAIVYGLTQGFSDFDIQYTANNHLELTSAGFDGPRELYADCDGRIAVSDESAPKNGRNGLWNLVGEGNTVTVNNAGESIFYSCSNPSDPLHGGQQVYVKNSESFKCPAPVVFTLVASPKE